MADTNDVLTLTEAKSALDIDPDDTSDDTKLASYVTAVSQLLDEQCGPIVQRIETNTVWTTEPTTLRLTGPLAAVGSVTPYSAGVALDALTESDTAGYRLTPKAKGTGTYTGDIIRTGSTWTERVVVNATHGRYADTDTVHPKFKRAAAIVLRNLWHSEDVSVGQAGGFDTPFPTFPAAYAIPNSARDWLAEDWNGIRNTAHVGVMWG